MQPVLTPEHLLTLGEPLAVELRCVHCSTVETVRVAWATIDPRVILSKDREWDGVALSQIITCASCGAVDEYEVSEDSYLLLALEAKQKGGRVTFGITRLSDGTEVRRPAAALAHLRAATVAQPTNPEAWRRLGDACERYHLKEESMAAWRKAVEVGPTEFEAAHSLTLQLFHDVAAGAATPSEAAQSLAVTVQRFTKPNAYPPEKRPGFAASLAKLLFHLADNVDNPVVLMASWNEGERDGEPIVSMSSAEIGRLTRRDTLAPFLAQGTLITLVLLLKRFSDEPTNLERLLDARDEAARRALTAGLLQRSVPISQVRAPKLPGRNDPCPCASGLKYKKCHGR